MAKTLEQVNVVVDVDTKGLSGGLDDAEKKVDKSEGKLKGKFSAIGKAAAAGMAVAAAAVIGLASSAVTLYADYEQLAGGVETLFKESSHIIDQYAENAYKTAGLSANQYMETVTGFAASLLQGLGGDTAEAARIGDMAITDMSDNANKMGSSMESIQLAYQGFAKQQYGLLDNLKLGYGGTKGEMERLLADAEKMPEAMGRKFDLSNYADVIKAINVVQQNMGITGTTAKEASETISGSLNAMKASWANVLTFMGGGTSMAWDDIFPAFVETVKTFASNIIPVIKDVLFGITKLIAELAPIIVAEIPALFSSILPPLLEAVINLGIAIIDALPGIVQAVVESLVTLLPKIAEAIPTLVNSLTNAIPIIIEAAVSLLRGIIDALPQIVPALIQGVTTLVIELATALTQPDLLTTILEAGLTLLMELVKALPQVIIALAKALPDIISNIIIFLTKPETIMMLIGAAIEMFMALVTAIPEIIVALVEAIPKIIEALVNFFTDPSSIQEMIGASVQLFMGLVQAVPQILSALFGAFQSLFGALWGKLQGIFAEFGANFGASITSVFKGAVNGVLGFLEGFINGPIDLINGAIDAINAIPGVSVGKLGRVAIPRLATGGIVEPGGRIIHAGDGGEDEWVIPQSKMASLLGQMSGGGGGDTYEIHIHGVFATSPAEQRKVAEQIWQRLEELKRSKLGATT